MMFNKAPIRTENHGNGRTSLSIDKAIQPGGYFDKYRSQRDKWKDSQPHIPRCFPKLL